MLEEIANPAPVLPGLEAFGLAGVACDLGIEADHLTLSVDQRPARAARIERRVGLDGRRWSSYHQAWRFRDSGQGHRTTHDQQGAAPPAALRGSSAPPRPDTLWGSLGDVAEWLRSGLQSRLHRFDSGRRLEKALQIGTFSLGRCAEDRLLSQDSPQRRSTRLDFCAHLQGICLASDSSIPVPRQKAVDGDHWAKDRRPDVVDGPRLLVVRTRASRWRHGARLLSARSGEAVDVATAEGRSCVDARLPRSVDCATMRVSPSASSLMKDAARKVSLPRCVAGAPWLAACRAGRRRA